ncbi:hypothetical protein ACEN2J_15530 [Pseudorhodobacter sp. W20_MBD10_FR17]|uniref:hypothetical protein n=1 Tax=Pseudorhodobacter sp. W20_MBD10_FR17 TaxID=3240266 RepID=UPI003F9C337D
MSIWISKAVLISLLLSGCVMPDSTGGDLASGAGAEPTTLSFADIELAGPAGFCPLPSTQRLLDDASFVAFAPCNGKLGPVLAATVGSSASATGITLKSSTMGPYFNTQDGKSALRGENSNDDINVHAVDDYKAAVILQLTRVAQGQPSESWRALMQVDGRLVTLTVRPRQNTTLTPASGKRLITRFIDAMRAANGL